MVDALFVMLIVAAAAWYAVRRFMAAQRTGGGCGCSGCGDGTCRGSKSGGGPCGPGTGKPL